MPNDWTKLYQQLRGATAPSPEQQMAAKDEELKRAFLGRMSGGGNPVEGLLTNAVQGLKNFGKQQVQRYQQMEQTYKPSEPQALQLDPGNIGVIPDLPNPAFATTPLFSKAAKLLKIDPEAMMSLLEGNDLIHGVSRGLASRYLRKAGITDEEKIITVADSLKDEATEELVKIINKNIEAGNVDPDGNAVVAYDSLKEFFDEELYPILTGNMKKYAEKEIPTGRLEAAAGGGRTAEEAMEVVDEGLEALPKKSHAPAGQVLRDQEKFLAGASAEPEVLPMAGKNLIPKGTPEASVIKKVLLQGESNKRAMIDAGWGSFKASEKGPIPTGQILRGEKSPFQLLIGDKLSSEMFRPNVLLEKKGATIPDILKAVNEVIETPPRNVNWLPFRRAAYNYLIGDFTPHQAIQSLNPRAGKAKLPLNVERKYKSQLEAITKRVLEKFGIKRSIQDVNNSLRGIE